MPSSAGPLARTRLTLAELSDALRTCAEFVLGRPWEARGLSIYELAARSGVSTHAVSRFTRRLGYGGYREFSQALATELGQIQGAAYAIPDALVPDLPTVDAGGGAAGVVARVLAVERAVSSLARARRVLFVTTGAGLGVCELAVYRFKVLGVAAACTPDPATLIPEIHLLEPGDVVIGVSYHGYSRGVVEGLAYARERELTTICITAAAGSPAARRADIQLVVSGRTEALILGQFSSRVTTAALLEALVTGVAWLRRDEVVSHAAEVTLAAQRRTSVLVRPRTTRSRKPTN
jgi:RpiR family transcriptional regulator, carbohydrate utilization regulator